MAATELYYPKGVMERWFTHWIKEVVMGKKSVQLFLSPFVLHEPRELGCYVNSVFTFRQQQKYSSKFMCMDQRVPARSKS